jgi:hypothetical protein
MLKIWTLGLVVIAMIGCSKSSSAPSERDAQTAYEGYRTSKGFCLGQVVAFRKVNGFQRPMGPTSYHIVEFEAEENRSTCPGMPWETKGDKLLIGGEIVFIPSEKGWKAEIIECGEKMRDRWIVVIHSLTFNSRSLRVGSRQPTRVRIGEKSGLRT